MTYNVKNIRQSNFELLRIIAMFMIILIHANMHLSKFESGIGFSIANGTINGICNIGVTLFILISGYFGLKFDIKKLIRMELMMITFSLIETGVLCLFKPDYMQGRELIEHLAKSFLPFISRKYWFYSCYVVIFLFSGFIEKLIESISEKEYRVLLILLLLIFSVFPTAFYFEISMDNGKGIVQMLMIYLIGRYIRLYRDDTVLPRWSIVIFALLWLINGISHDVNFKFNVVGHHLCKDNSITNIAMAIILFFLFKSMRFESKIVNLLAKPMFAVFALNNTLVAIVFDRVGRQYHGVYVEILLVAFVFVVCILFGYIRELILKRVDKHVCCYIEGLVKKRFGNLL